MTRPSSSSCWLRGTDFGRTRYRGDCRSGTGSAPVVANRDGLQQVFWNLVNNSLDAMTEEGGMCIATRLDERPDDRKLW